GRGGVWPAAHTRHPSAVAAPGRARGFVLVVLAAYELSRRPNINTLHHEAPWLVKRISVITPVRQDTAVHLTAAHDSLRRQLLPGGWTWEWVVQEDGQTGAIVPLLPRDDSRLSLGTGRSGGPAVARNMALARATGELVKVLDADDMLIDGSLAREIDVLTANADVGWTSCRALDLLENGSRVGFEHDPPAGRLPRGGLLAHWQTHDHHAEVHPATLCIRRELLVALGGWMALPASEDTGLLLAADAISDGWFIPEPGLLYRKWPGQATARPEHIEPTERRARMSLIEQRALRLAADSGEHVGA
ncbi:MAG: glycosyltransferase family 2 protein, partial [Trebonia sp.]